MKTKEKKTTSKRLLLSATTNEQNFLGFAAWSFPRMLLFSIIFTVAFSTLISTATSASQPCTNPTPFTFGPSSQLQVRYSLLLNHSGSLPLVADVTGDQYPELFFVVAGNPAQVQSLSYDQTLDDFLITNRSLPTGVDFSSLALAKVPNSIWIVCGINVGKVFCGDATTGVRTLNDPLRGYTLKNDALRSSVSIDRLFKNEPNNVYVLAPAVIYRYNSSGPSFYCNITYLDALVVPIAIDIDLDGDSEIFYNNCVYSPYTCTELWCAAITANFSNGDFVTSAVANMDADPYGEVVFSGGGQAVAYNHDGTLIWTATMSKRGGPPTLADITGDG